MDTFNKLEKAINEMVKEYSKQKEEIESLRSRMEKLQGGDSSDWTEEKKSLKKRINALIKIIEDLGVKID